MGGDVALLLIILGVFFGLIGIAVAQNKGVSSAAGFWLGAFLGPLGLIVVALLSPGQVREPSRRPAPLADCQRDLGVDAYRIWLVSHYDIQKNEVLGSYVCMDTLFATVDEALLFAHGLEVESVQRERVEAEAFALRAETERRRAELERAAYISPLTYIRLRAREVIRQFQRH